MSTISSLALAMTAALQTPATSSCRDVLDFIVGKVELNYPGFPDKVTAANRSAYDDHTRRVRTRTASVTSDTACHAALLEWIGFFKEGHMTVGQVGSASAPTAPADTTPASLRARFGNSPARGITESEVRSRWADRRATDRIEGIWEAVGADYRYAVVPDSGGTFVAVVLRADGAWWVPGQIKAWITSGPSGDYAVRYLMRDHSERSPRAKMTENVLTIADPVNATWIRVEPRQDGELTLDDLRNTLNPPARFERLSNETVVIHAPSFGDNQAPILDSIVSRHRDEITRARNLIIDVRGNGGGSDYVYAPLLPLLYTNPIIDVNASILATPDNISKFELLLDNPQFPESQKPSIRELVKQLQATAGRLMRRSDDTLTLATVLARPERVAVIMDRRCGSSCEQFVLAARQSRKVTLFGDNTSGVLDYANVHRLTAPGGRFVLIYPTSRSQRLPQNPVDPHGIAPDVRVPADELRPVQWVWRRLEP